MLFICLFVYLECNAGAKYFEGTVSSDWMTGGRKGTMNWMECGRRVVVLLVCCPETELKHTQYQVRITSALNAIEAGKLPNTIQESCPLRLDDWLSFPTDRQ